MAGSNLHIGQGVPRPAVHALDLLRVVVSSLLHVLLIAVLANLHTE